MTGCMKIEIFPSSSFAAGRPPELRRNAVFQELQLMLLSTAADLTLEPVQ